MIQMDRRGWYAVDLARLWRVSTGVISKMLNGQRRINPLQALRLEATFPETTAEQWLAAQAAQDLVDLRAQRAQEMEAIRLRADLG